GTEYPAPPVESCVEKLSPIQSCVAAPLGSAAACGETPAPPEGNDASALSTSASSAGDVASVAATFELGAGASLACFDRVARDEAVYDASSGARAPTVDAAAAAKSSALCCALTSEEVR